MDSNQIVETLCDVQRIMESVRSLREEVAIFYSEFNTAQVCSAKYRRTLLSHLKDKTDCIEAARAMARAALDSIDTKLNAKELTAASIDAFGELVDKRAKADPIFANRLLQYARDAALRNSAVTTPIKTENSSPVQRKRSRPVYTYLILNKRNGYTKIGRSSNPTIREKTLQAEDPDVQLLAKCRKNIEAPLHIAYREFRLRGEWFNLTESQRLEIISRYFNRSNDGTNGNGNSDTSAA